jgi:hypothetical protein
MSNNSLVIALTHIAGIGQWQVLRRRIRYTHHHRFQAVYSLHDDGVGYGAKAKVIVHHSKPVTECIAT